MVLDRQGNPLHLLEPGQRKTIRNHRVALVAGEPAEVAAIRRIFHEFVDLGYSTARIAKGLNAKHVPSPSGSRWLAGHVRACLRTKAYAGRLIYRRKRTRGRTPEEWVREPNAIVGLTQFQRALAMLAEARMNRLHKARVCES